MDSPQLSHINGQLQPQMVDISDKPITGRLAQAQALVWFPPTVANQLQLNRAAPGQDLAGPKGSIFQTAILAGIMGAKRTAELIPLCHALPLDKIEIDITVAADGLIDIRSRCRTSHKTGVEMEALTAVAVAALTVYDMTKALSPEIQIRSIRLLSKSGGKRDYAAS